MALYNQDTAGKPIQKIYKRIGIRRDRNFSDLSNPTAGLENLLDSLVDVTGTQFLSADLGAIKNVFSRGLTNSNYLNIAGSSVKFTSASGITASFDPRITYQNRLDKLEIFTGEPRFAGGNGLTAKYFQNDQINFDTDADFNYNVDPNTTAADVFSGITTEGIIPDDNFWEEGDFDYTGNVHPQSSKVNTGVKWEGYFVPRITGTVDFHISSTGYFTFDFQQVGYLENNDGEIISPSGIGTYTEHARVGVSTVISGISSTSIANQIVVSGAANIEKMNTIGIGMTVVHPNIVPGTKITSENGDFSKITGVINLEPPAGNTSAFTAPISNQDVSFVRSLGTSVRHVFSTQVLRSYERYRVRIRYFHPRTFLARNITREFDFDFREQDMPSTDDVRFNRLFALDYDFSNSAKGDFNIFNDNSIRFGGSNLSGIGSDGDKTKYVKVTSTSKVDVTYQVKKELGSDVGSKIDGIIRRKFNCTMVNGSAVVFTGLTSDLEIGNYVFGTGIPTDARIIEITLNQFIILNKPVTATGVNELTFINHRGFVKKVTCDGSGTTLSNATPALKADPSTMKTINTDVQKGMIVIGNLSDFNSYTEVEKVDSTTALTLKTTTPLKQSFTSQDVYIYQSRGLKDNTLQKFCDTFTTTPSVQCLIATGPVSTTSGIIPVETTTDGSGVISAGAINSNNIGNNNWKVQGFNFKDGTTITFIQNGYIVLNQTIEKEMVSNTQFTATLNSDDRQLCCPPTDTSPPFTANVDGLITDAIARPNLRFAGGNLIFSQLTIQNNGSNVTDAVATDSVNRKIDIQTPSGTFKILAFDP